MGVFNLFKRSEKPQESRLYEQLKRGSEEAERKQFSPARAYEEGFKDSIKKQG